MRFRNHADTIDPFTPLGWLRGEMDRLFDHAAPSVGSSWAPPVALHETEQAYEARLPIAGADSEKLEIRVEGGLLHISGERLGAPADAERHYASERVVGPFRREVRLPAAVDAERVEARYVNGVLELSLPKAAEALPRRIPVQL